MEKKITSQGPRDRASYTVTLPKEWIKKEDIDKTKKVNLEIAGNKIIISPEDQRKENITINSEDYKDVLDKILPQLYRMGIKEIEFKIYDENLIEKISDIINKKLISYEIVEHKKDSLIIKYITKESEEDFKVILRRIFLLLIEMPKTKSKIGMKTIGENISRLSNYCQRILIKKGHIEFLKIPFYYLLLNQLEKISDELEWILNIGSITSKEKEILKELSNLLEKGYNLFYKFNPRDYNTYAHRLYKLKNEIKLDKINIVKMHLHNLARLLNSMSGTIFAIKFESIK